MFPPMRLSLKFLPWRSAALAALLCLGTAFAQEGDESGMPEGFVGTLEASPTTAVVGDTVTLSGHDLPADATLELAWSTYDLDWDLGETDGEFDGTFRGLTRSEASPVSLASVETDADGSFRTTFEIPEDFGGTHNVLVRRDGETLNRVGVDVRADMKVEPSSGPVGTDVTVTITGLNAGHPMVWYQLTWDHAIVGFPSAVKTRGTAEAVVPATGRVGPHRIGLEDSPFGQPYLALDTSPWARLELPDETFTITEGDPILPPPVSEQDPPSVEGSEPMGDGPQMWTDPEAAPVGTEATLHGKGFEPGATLELEMGNMTGSRVTASGFTPTTEPFGTVTVDDDGRFAMPFDFPDTLGGGHPLTASVEGQEEPLARTSMRVLPRALPLEDREVPYGEEMRVHLKGIGWTQTENIFAVVVDNVYIGYACGFSTNGDVNFPLEATFEPGWHYIDIYPSFYRNEDYSEVDEAPFLFRHALLSWEDHPSGFHYRYAFKVVEETE